MNSYWFILASSVIAWWLGGILSPLTKAIWRTRSALFMQFFLHFFLGHFRASSLAFISGPKQIQCCLILSRSSSASLKAVDPLPLVELSEEVPHVAHIIALSMHFSFSNTEMDQWLKHDWLLSKRLFFVFFPLFFFFFFFFDDLWLTPFLLPPVDLFLLLVLLGLGFHDSTLAATSSIMCRRFNLDPEPPPH